MAQLIITIPDEAVPRIKTAFGWRNSQTLEWVDATQQAVIDRVKQFIRSKVIEYETEQAASTTREAKSKEQW